MTTLLPPPVYGAIRDNDNDMLTLPPGESNVPGKYSWSDIR